MSAVSKRKIKLAIFDIDGTIFRSSLLIQLIDALVAARIFPRRAIKQIENKYEAWLDRRGDYDEYLKQVIRVHERYIIGCSAASVMRIAHSVVAKQKNRVYRYTRDLIRQMRRREYFLVAISGSPSYMVSQFARGMGFRIFFGTEFEVKGGSFTGEKAYSDTITNKAKVIEHFLVSHNLHADLAGSVAVGDSESDIPMLSYVGRPIAFNPSRKLANYARSKGWKIVIERKNIAVGLKDFTFEPVGS